MTHEDVSNPTSAEPKLTKRELARQIELLSYAVNHLELRLEREQQTTFRLVEWLMDWSESPHGEVLTAIGPLSDRLFSIVPEHDGQFVLNWPGGTCHCASVEELQVNAARIECYWSPAGRPVSDSHANDTERTR